MDEAEFQELMRYQASLSRKVVQEARTDRKLKLLDIANELTRTKKKIQTAALLHEAEHQRFSEQEAYDLLDELIEDGFIAEAGKGYVQRT